MRPITAPLLLAATSILLGESGAHFRPDPGSSAVKRLEERTSWRLEVLEENVEFVGREMPDVEADLVRVLSFEDGYGPAAEGSGDPPRLAELERGFGDAYVELELQAAEGGEVLEVASRLRSPLEGETALFRWDEDGEEHEVEGEAEADLLERLSIESDCRSLLPAGEVAEGDAWELEAADLLELFLPGGRVRMDADEVYEGSIATIPTTMVLAVLLTNLGDALGEEVEGGGEATLDGAVEEDGRELVRITFTFELASEADRTERLAALASSVLDDLDESALELSLAVEISGDGELLWDPAAGRMHRLSLEGELFTEADVSWVETYGDMEIPIEGYYEVAGSTSITFAVEEE